MTKGQLPRNRWGFLRCLYIESDANESALPNLEYRQEKEADPSTQYRAANENSDAQSSLYASKTTLLLE